MAGPPLQLMIAARRPLATDVVEFTLHAADGVALPPFEPGAHVTVETPSGARRRYSLVNDGRAPERYVIAVKREAASRGGSASLHEAGRVGTPLAAETPGNDFPLTEAPDYLLIAGGIGVTPIQAMARELDRRGRPFRMIYCARSPQAAAYADELGAALGDRLTLHHDGGDPARAYDFWDHFIEPRPTHVFCCGPHALMEEIRAVSGHWPEGRVHFEDFRPVDAVRPYDVAFEVELARSGRVLRVPAERTILEALREAGIRAASSCESGVCGTCRQRLLAGEAEHRDQVLSESERADNMMICVSRAVSGRLVLDL